MYKENQLVETYEGEQKTVNLETVAVKRNCYLWRFDCRVCKNQSINSDEPVVTRCNNFKDFSDKQDRNYYCENYVRDIEYCRVKGVN